MSDSLGIMDATTALTPLGMRLHEIARQDRSAAMLVLTTPHMARRARLRIAAGIVTTSVYAQAGLLGLVTCTRCGDRGCDWCG